MPRKRRRSTIEERIAKAQNEYQKAEMKFTFATAKLEKIKEKYEKIKRDRLVDEIIRSGRSVEEIAQLLKLE